MSGAGTVAESKLGVSKVLALQLIPALSAQNISVSDASIFSFAATRDSRAEPSVSDGGGSCPRLPFVRSCPGATSNQPQINVR
jgi:hypothetical protein